MSTELEVKEEEMMGTKPEPQHEWLQKLVGEWTTETEMTMESGEQANHKGTEVVTNLGGLWAFGEGNAKMPNGDDFTSKFALGWDVTEKAYKAMWIGSVSSHLWKYDGELSADGKTMTMNCKGPNMSGSGGDWANYRDVIEIVDDNYRTLTSYGEGEDGEWTQFMKMHVRRK